MKIIKGELLPPSRPPVLLWGFPVLLFLLSVLIATMLYRSTQKKAGLPIALVKADAPSESLSTPDTELDVSAGWPLALLALERASGQGVVVRQLVLDVEGGTLHAKVSVIDLSRLSEYLSELNHVSTSGWYWAFGEAQAAADGVWDVQVTARWGTFERPLQMHQRSDDKAG